MAHPLRSIARAASGGLVLGLLGSAVIFLYNARLNATRDCTFPGTQECQFELENALEIGRLQSLAAIGCVLIGGGLFLAMRRQ